MKKRSDDADHQADLREKIIGLGKGSLKKSSYPELQRRLTELEESEAKLRESLAALENANETLQQEIAERRQAEEALRGASLNWQTTFDAISDGVCLLDRESRIVQANQAFLEFVGKPAAEVAGRHCWEVVHGTQAPLPKCPVVRMRESRNRESMLLPMDGRWFEVTVDPILDAAGNLTGAVHIITDITAHKQAEEARRATNEKLEAIIQASPAAIISLDHQGLVTHWSPEAEKMFGWQAEEVLGRLNPIVPENKLAEFHGLREQVLKGNSFSDVELIRRKKDGTPIPISLSTAPLRNAEGNITGIMSVSLDITDRQRAEEEILRFASFPRLNPNPVLEVDLDGQITFANEAAQATLRKLGRQDITAFLPPDLEALIQSYREKGVKRFYREVEIDAAVFAQTIHVAEEFKTLRLFAIDITARQQTEEALRTSESFLNSIFYHSPYPTWISDDQGNLIRVNLACQDMLHITQEDVVGKYNVFQDNIVEQQGFLPLVQRVFKEGETIRSELTYDSSLLDTLQLETTVFVILDVTVSPIKDASGKVTNAVFQHIDITERKQAETALRESEELYRSLFDNMLNGLAYGKILFEHNQPQDYIYLSVNHSFEALTGLKDVVGKKVSEVIPGIREADPELFEILGRVALTGNPERFEIYLEALKMWFAISVYSPAKEYFVAVFDVITDRKQAEEALRQGAEEMAALHAVAHQVSSSLALDQVVSIILGQAVHPLAPDLALLYLWQGDELVFQGARPDDASHHNEAAQLQAGECLCGLALDAGKPVYSSNIHTDPRCTLAACKAAGLLSFAALPLLSPEGVLGVLGLAWATEQDVEARGGFLETIAQEIALGLYNALMYAKIQDNVDKLDLRVQDLAALNQASQVFLGEIGVAATSQETCRLAVEHFGLRLAWVGLVHPGDYLVHPAASFGAEAGYLDAVRITWDDSPTGRGPTGTAIRTRQHFIMNNIETDAAFAPWREAARTRGYRSSAAFPLCIGDEVLGALNLYSEQADFFIEDRIQVVQSFANQAAVALQKARLYEEIQRHAAELEDRVAERTAQLQATNLELDRFAYSVSHDLRAPLRAMQGFSQALLEDYTGELNPTGQDFARRIVAAAERMDHLTQDLLAYSRLSREEMALQPVSLEQTVAETMAHLEGDLRARQAQVRVEPPLPEVQAHHTTLLQVVANLVSNAIRFTAPDVKPQVRLWAEAREGRVRLWVEDNGLGLAPEHQERIFRIFERLHGVEAYPGTGIGLAIVRKGVERMGGQVGVESTPGQGSRFWVELAKAG